MTHGATTQALWSHAMPAQRGRPARISRSDLVSAAVRIADDEGVSAVSMQRVAEAVGVTKMALYRHVPGRAELVSLMVDEAIGPPPQLDLETWRRGVTGWAVAMHRAFSAHRWLLASTVGPRVLGPNELGWFEAGLRTLAPLPLSATERLDAMTAVNSHVRGIALQQTELGSRRTLGGILGDLLSEHAGQYRLTAAAFLESTRSAQPDEQQEQDSLCFGLDLMLDGLEALAASRTASGQRDGGVEAAGLEISGDG